MLIAEKHPNIDTLDDKVVTLKACSLNQKRVCQWNMEIYMRKCNDDLLYAYPWFDRENSDIWYQHICFGKIFQTIVLLPYSPKVSTEQFFDVVLFCFILVLI